VKVGVTASDNAECGIEQIATARFDQQEELFKAQAVSVVNEGLSRGAFGRTSKLSRADAEAASKCATADQWVSLPLSMSSL
jgi:hypothetical protein